MRTTRRCTRTTLGDAGVTARRARTVPGASVRRLENVDTIVRERVRAGAAPQVIRLNRTIIHI